MATSLKLGFDPVALPKLVERKGTLFLRSDHKKYSRVTLANGWHAARESEPKDYDISQATDQDRNLLLATYNRIGNIPHDQSLLVTTTKKAMKEGQELKEDYTEKQIHQPMIRRDNFFTATLPRDEGSIKHEYGSILPYHKPDHNIQHLETTQRRDYQYRLPLSPTKNDTPVNAAEKSHRRILSEFTDTASHRHTGTNLWQDYRTTKQ